MEHRTGGYPHKRAQTRRRLLRAGLLVVAERGVLAATVGDVAARAGVAAGTFYNHFPTKDDLVEALVGELLTDIQLGAQGVREAEDDPAGRVVLGLLSLLSRAASEPEFGLALLELAPHCPLRQHLRRLIGATIDEGVSQGRFNVRTDEETTDAALGVALEAVRACGRDPLERASPPRFARLLLGLLGVEDHDADRVVAGAVERGVTQGVGSGPGPGAGSASLGLSSSSSRWAVSG